MRLAKAAVYPCSIAAVEGSGEPHRALARVNGVGYEAKRIECAGWDEVALGVVAQGLSPPCRVGVGWVALDQLEERHEIVGEDGPDVGPEAQLLGGVDAVGPQRLGVGHRGVLAEVAVVAFDRLRARDLPLGQLPRVRDAGRNWKESLLSVERLSIVNWIEL